MQFYITLSLDPFLQQTAVDFNHKLDSVLLQLKVIHMDLATIKAQDAALVAQVAQQGTLADSIVTLLNGFTGKLTDIQTRLDAAIANAANPADVADIQTISDDIGAQVSNLSAQAARVTAAIPANTPTPAGPPATVAVAPAAAVPPSPAT